MADLKIYNNGENKILMSAGDRIIRQPYEFGKAHDIRDSRGLPITDKYIRCKSPIENISDGAFAIVAFMDTGISWGNNAGVCRFESASYIAALGLTFRWSDNPKISFNKPLESTYGVGTTIAATNSSGFSMGRARTATFNMSKTKCSVFKDTAIGTEIDHSLISFTPETYNYFTFGRGTAGVYSYERGTRSAASWNRVLIFNRYVSPEEHLYFHNNSLGSDPQSYLDVILDVRCSFAEILDFSVLQDGSDMRVGCRDYSGDNRHGEIMNLPAGTLQEQLDWANANLFVPFIS